MARRWIDALPKLGLVAWAAVCAVVLATTANEQWRSLSRTCDQPPCIPLQLKPPAVAALADRAVTLPTYAGVVTTAAILVSLGVFALALLVVLRAATSAARTIPFVLLAIGATASTSFDNSGVLRQLVLWVAVGGIFWLIATFPSLGFGPKWAVVPTTLAVCWAGVTILISPVADDIAADDGPWAQAEGPVFATLLALILVAQVLRFRRSGPEVRRQLGLVLVAVAVLVIVGIGGALSGLGESGGTGTLLASGWQLAGSVALALVMACVAVALIKEQAYGVVTVVRRTLTAALMIAVVTAIYSLIVALLSIGLDGWVPGALAAVAAAALFAPVRSRITRAVDRLVYGDAGDPLLLVAALNHHLAEASSSAALLPEMAALIATRLRLPWVVVTTPPEVDSRLPSVPFELGAGEQGAIAFALRPGQRRASRRDLAALQAAAGPLAAAAAAVRLTDDLSRSRAALVNAREEERRTLRSQLHDEFGPTLASLRHRVNAARRDITTAPDGADSRLSEADGLLAQLLADVRALARGLRPPELDQFGLTGATERFAAGLAVGVSFEWQPFRDLPAAVEAAAYRILLEALVNADRHAEAATVVVRVEERDDRLRLEVVDDGIGPGGARAEGVGLTSMRERAEELGGSLGFGQAEPCGARLVCDLPLTEDR